MCCLFLALYIHFSGSASIRKEGFGYTSLTTPQRSRSSVSLCGCRTKHSMPLAHHHTQPAIPAGSYVQREPHMQRSISLFRAQLRARTLATRNSDTPWCSRPIWHRADSHEGQAQWSPTDGWNKLTAVKAPPNHRTATRLLTDGSGRTPTRIAIRIAIPIAMGTVVLRYRLCTADHRPPGGCR